MINLYRTVNTRRQENYSHSSEIRSKQVNALVCRMWNLLLLNLAVHEVCLTTVLEGNKQINMFTNFRLMTGLATSVIQ